MLNRTDPLDFIAVSRGIGEILVARNFKNTSKKALFLTGVTDIACGILGNSHAATPYLRLARYSARLIFIDKTPQNDVETKRQDTLVAASVCACVASFFGLHPIARLIHMVTGVGDLVSRFVL